MLLSVGPEAAWSASNRTPRCIPRTLAELVKGTAIRPDLAQAIGDLEKGVYAPAINELRPRLGALTPDDEKKIWRMRAKTAWRRADTAPAGAPAERRPKIKTNIERKAFQSGGLDESADAAPPFVIGKSDPRPANMPEGAYWLNSGRSGYYSPTINGGLRGGPRASERFEIVYQFRSPSGQIVAQRGGYAAPNSSWGWDGRFEYQPLPQGGHELIVTQGSMELPSKLQGAQPGSPDLPQVWEDNPTRSRHIYRIEKYQPATRSRPARLYVTDEGSILNKRPSTERRWIEADASGTLTHAHGYGENFIPDPRDPRKMWVDPDGYTWRVFDMVTEETTVRMPDGSIRMNPTETRSVGYRMDPKNPSKVVPRGTKLPNGDPADAPVFFTSPFFPGTRKPLPSAVRTLFDNQGTPIERRVIGLDGKVSLQTENLKATPPVLVEGFNHAPRAVVIEGESYYVMTGSGGEYTSGGIRVGTETPTQYGAYLVYRPFKAGPIGEYTPALNAAGDDFEDMLRAATEGYGWSWGLGRPQTYQDELGRWWVDAHGVDVDLLPAHLPQSGYPPSAKDFQDRYRRLKISIPIQWIKRNGQPAFKVDWP